MYTPNDYVVQTLRTDHPYASREDAIAALDTFKGHRIGQLITLLYRVEEEDEKRDVECIVAVGIKNASECGPDGAESTDRWENKHYPNGPCGREFYRIIADSQERDEWGYIREVEHGGEGEPEVDHVCGVTHITTVGNQHDVCNPTGVERTIEDPFVFKALDAEGRAMETNNQNNE